MPVFIVNLIGPIPLSGLFTLFTAPALTHAILRRLEKFLNDLELNQVFYTLFTSVLRVQATSKSLSDQSSSTPGQKYTIKAFLNKNLHLTIFWSLMEVNINSSILQWCRFSGHMNKIAMCCIMYVVQLNLVEKLLHENWPIKVYLSKKNQEFMQLTRVDK